MPNVKISDSPAQLDQILRPLGITRSSKNYRILCECVALICEQEDRLEAVQKEIYTPISDQRSCKWSAIQSAVRRAAEKAWALNPEGVQQLAGYPLTGAQRGAVPGDALQCRGEGVTKRLPREKVGLTVGYGKRKTPRNLRF